MKANKKRTYKAFFIQLGMRSVFILATILVFYFATFFIYAYKYHNSQILQQNLQYEASSMTSFESYNKALFSLFHIHSNQSKGGEAVEIQ